MIESAALTNFQRHARRAVAFDRRVTVISGRTDAGKSSVLRAVRFACLNKPAGDAFVRKGADFAEVTLVADGRTLVRHRGADGNYYLLDGVRYEFDAENKRGVPDPIAQFLAVGDANFASQHDGAYWFDRTPGEVSRELNAIVNLALIDRTLANLAAGVRDARAEVKVTERRAAEARERADALAWTKLVAGRLAALEERGRAVAEAVARHERLRELLAELVDAEATHRRGKALIRRGDKCLQRGERLQALTARIDHLQRVLSGMRKLEMQAKLGKVGKRFDRIDALAVDLRGRRERAASLADLLTHIRAAEDDLCRARESTATAEAELGELVGTTCPVCGSTIPSS